jgi:hypothetical protein
VTDVDPSVAALAANPSVPDDLLLALAETDDEDIQRVAVTRATARRLPAATVEVLSRSPHEGVRATLVGRIEVPDHVLIRLARDPSLLVRQSVAARFEEPWTPVEHYAPVEAYEALVDDDDDTIRDELLTNPEVPADIVRRLMRHDEIRDLVLLRVGDPDEAEAAHRRLLTSPKPLQRRVALTDPRFRPPADLAAALATDLSMNIEAAAWVPLTRALAESLVAHEEPAVRGGVAWNPELPDDLVAVLGRDADDWVRFRTLQRPHIPFEMAEAIEYDQDPEAQTGSVEWVWESRQDMALLDRLSGSRHPAYRRTVARVPDLPQSIVDRLADDEDFLVRRALAETNTDRVPVSTLRDLLLRGAGPKRNEIVKNPRVPDDLIDELSRSPEADHRWTAFHSGRLTDDQKARLARDPDPKLAAAVNPPPPPTEAQLRARLADLDPRVRKAAAKDPAMPVELMWELARAAGVRR